VIKYAFFILFVILLHVNFVLCLSN